MVIAAYPQNLVMRLKEAARAMGHIVVPINLHRKDYDLVAINGVVGMEIARDFSRGIPIAVLCSGTVELGNLAMAFCVKNAELLEPSVIVERIEDIKRYCSI